jgi:hypothetical protein
MQSVKVIQIVSVRVKKGERAGELVALRRCAVSDREAA